MTPSRLAVVAVGLLGLVNLGRGSIHLFAPDGGAGTIAGLDLSSNAPTILFLFATLGAGQIAMGLVDLTAAARARSFVRPLLAIHVAQGALVAYAFLVKPPPVVVPGQWFNLALFAALALVAVHEFVRKDGHARPRAA